MVISRWKADCESPSDPDSPLSRVARWACPKLVEALHAVEEEFPVEDYRVFVDAIALSIEQGAPLVTTLGDMSDSMQSEIENELLGKGLRTATPMVLGMGIALINIFVLIGAPLASLWLSSP